MLQEVRDKSRPQLDTKGRCIECISRDLRITVVNSKLMMAPVDPGSASKQASFAFSAIQTESVEHNQTDNQSSLVRTSNLSFQHDPDLVNVSTSTDPGNVHQTDASLADAELMQEDDLAKAMPNSERESQNYDVLGDYFASVNSSLVVERVMDNDDVKERIIPHFATVQTQTESAFHGRSAESQTEFMPDEARTQTSDMIGGHADKDTQTLKGDISCANEGVHSNGRSHDISATDLSDVKYEEGYKQSPVQRRSSMIIQPSKSNRRRRRLSNKPADSSVPAVAARDPIEDDEFISARQSTLENRRKSFLSSAAQYPDLHQAHRSSRVAGIAGAATKRAGKTPRIRRTVVKVALKTTNHENSSENEEPTSPPHERLSGPTRRRSSSLRIEDIGLPVVNAASRRRGALIGALQAGSRKPLDAVMGTAGVSSSVSLDASIQKLSGPLLGRKGVGKRQSGGEAVVVLAPVWRRRSNDTEKYGIGASAEPTLAVSPELENAQRVEQDSDEEEPKRKRRLRIEKSIMPVEDSPMVKPRRKRMTRK
ncbi:hypothetical protein BC830DRAFT_562041 [Chytriomyces sp. MP71]|nr:hypothetical protein BC830DRAFT_562041 [Chytriomyces sp. MP71]